MSQGVEREHNRTFESQPVSGRSSAQWERIAFLPSLTLSISPAVLLDLSYHADGRAGDRSEAPIESRASVRQRNPYAQPERKPPSFFGESQQSAAEFEFLTREVVPDVALTATAGL